MEVLIFGVGLLCGLVIAILPGRREPTGKRSAAEDEPRELTQQEKDLAIQFQNLMGYDGTRKGQRGIESKD